MIEKELLKYSTNQELTTWYHIVIYCIGANSGRVQPFELEIIKKIVNAGYGVIIAFTKADVATEDELNDLRNTVDDYFDNNTQLAYIPICSKKSRNGKLEGKEELSNKIFSSWKTSIINRLPDHIYSYHLDEIDEWWKSLLEWIDEQNIGLFGKSQEELLEDVNDILANQINEWNQKIKRKQKKSEQDIRSTFCILNQVLNISSISTNNIHTSSNTPFIDESVLDNSSSTKSIVKGIALGALVLINPLVAIPLGISSIFLSKAKNSDAKEKIKNELREQYFKFIDSYFLQQEIYRDSLSASMGYLSGYRGLGTKYLLGIGLNKNISLSLSYFRKIIDIVEESNFEYTDPYSEFFYSYIQFLKGDRNDANKWLILANKHGSTRAKLVLKGIPYREIAENEDYEN